MTEPVRESPLTLAWWSKRPMSMALPGFLILSLFAHAFAFVLFQVAYPEKVSIPAAAPRVSLLTASSPENISLLHWIESEDPALVAASARAEPTGLARLEYKPFFAAIHTPARILAPAIQKTPFPAGRDPLDVISSLSPSISSPARTEPPTKTHMALSGEFAGRELRQPPPFTTCGKAPLDSTQFLIGVTDRGEIRYTFVQHSSGDPVADDAAAAALSKASFEPSETPVTWGIATVCWGDDAYSAAARAVAPPAEKK